MNGIIRHSWAHAFLALTVSFVGAALSEAQTKSQPGTVQSGAYHGGITPTPWFNNPTVRQEFKLNGDQYTRLNNAYQNAWTQYQQGVNGIDKTLSGEQRQQRMRDLQQGFYNGFSKSTDAILADPAQRQRYNQLYWQYRGYGAFEDPAVADKLKLSAEQREKLRQLHTDWSKQLGDIGSAYQKNPEDAAKRFTKLQSNSTNGLNSVLTPEQRQTWQQMIGNPYTFQPNAYFQTNVTGSKK